MKYYYAAFEQTQEAIEVEFPDLPGCVTFGDTWDEAYENAVDVLAAWLKNAEKQFIVEPSPYDIVKNHNGQIFPIPVNEQTIESYNNSFNVKLSNDILVQIDKHRKIKGINRSGVLLQAVEEYLKNHRLDAQQAVQ